MYHFLVVLLACLTAAELYNDEFDVLLAGHNKVANRVTTFVKNNTVTIGPYVLSEGVFVGDNSVYRIGDSRIDKVDTMRTSMTFTYGWRLFVLGFGKIQVQGKTTSGLFRVRKAAFQCDHEVLEKNGKCSVFLRYFRFLALDGVTMESSSPLYDGIDVSPVFSTYLLPKINEYFKTLKPDYQAVLDDLICRDIGEPRLQSYVMSAVAEFFNKSM